MFSPGARRTEGTVNVEPVIVAATPLTSALTTPDPTVPLTAIVSCAVAKFSSGALMVIDGLPVTRCSVMVTGVPVGVPAASVQVMLTVFGPSTDSSTVAVNAPSATVAATPLTFTPIAPPERPTSVVLLSSTTDPLAGSNESSLQSA